MKINLSFQLLSRVSAVVFLLLSLKTMATPCDEACSAEAPACECICVCYDAKDTVVQASDVLSAMNVAQYAVQFEASHQSLFLVIDVFRPPIA